MDSGRPQAGGQGVAGDSIVLEEEIDQNYVPSEVKAKEMFLLFLFFSLSRSRFCICTQIRNIFHMPRERLEPVCMIRSARRRRCASTRNGWAWSWTMMSTFFGLRKRVLRHLCQRTGSLARPWIRTRFTTSILQRVSFYLACLLVAKYLNYVP